MFFVYSMHGHVGHQLGTQMTGWGMVEVFEEELCRIGIETINLGGL